MPSGIFKRKPFTEEHRKNLSEAKKGKPTWNKDKRGIYSQELRKKIGDKLMGVFL